MDNQSNHNSHPPSSSKLTKNTQKTSNNASEKYFFQFNIKKIQSYLQKHEKQIHINRWFMQHCLHRTFVTKVLRSFACMRNQHSHVTRKQFSSSFYYFSKSMWNWKEINLPTHPHTHAYRLKWKIPFLLLKFPFHCLDFFIFDLLLYIFCLIFFLWKISL
jgi:hypothetical protein